MYTYVPENDPAPVNFSTAEGEPRVFTLKEKIYAAIIIVLSFLFVEFEIFNPMGFFTTAVNVLIITASIVFLKKKECKMTAINRIMAVVLYAFSAVFSITDNNVIKLITAAFLFLAGAYFVYSAGEGKKEIERYLPFAMVKAVFEFPLDNFGTEILAVKAAAGNSKTAGTIKYIIIGLIITMPVTAVVAALLISADAGMENIFNSISVSLFSFKTRRILFHLGISIPCSFYLYSMLYTNSKRDKIKLLDKNFCEGTINGAKVIPNAVLYTAVTPVLLLYVMFFISQASYFLSAFSDSLPEGYSYSEYARRGFFELCAITVINLLIISFISLLAKKGGREKPAALKFCNTALSISTLILIAVAISKMIMYISHYGLTPLRFYTMWFMLLCALLFILIIVKQFRFEINFAAWSTGLFTFMLAVLCFSCPDRLIAMYNIEMYNSGQLDELDVDMLCKLSDDAVLYCLEHGAISESKAANAGKTYIEDFSEKTNIPSLILNDKLRDEKYPLNE